jgi:hypothetical protein
MCINFIHLETRLQIWPFIPGQYWRSDKNTKSNFLLILVLPILSKVLEKLVCKQLITYLNGTSLLYRFQSSYLKGFSTIIALTCITNDIFNSMENKEITLLTQLLYWTLAKPLTVLITECLWTSSINMVLPAHLRSGLHTIWLTEQNA